MTKYQKRKKRVGKIEKDILVQLTAGDLIYGMLLSAHSTRRLYRLPRERAMERYRRKKAIERLAALDFLKIHGERLSITDSGKGALGSVAIENRALLDSATWDGKWRIALFDIPEEFAPLRDRVRHILKKAGFVQFQKSVWIFPHECEELVRFLKEESGLAKHILYGVLERVENEKILKRHFSLVK